MELQINIKNIKINSISTLGSLNVGKVMFADNRASSIQESKPDYEENELDEDVINQLVPPMNYPLIDFPSIK